MTSERVEALAAEGVTRLVVGGEEDELTGFAERFGLRTSA
jgi:hypothetical protein